MKSKIVRLAVVLALVVSLFAVYAPPVAATITQVLATPTTTTVGSVSEYTVSWVTTQTYTAATVLTLDFPDNMTLPAGVAVANLRVGGVTNTTNNATGAAAAVTNITAGASATNAQAAAPTNTTVAVTTGNVVTITIGAGSSWVPPVPGASGFDSIAVRFTVTAAIVNPAIDGAADIVTVDSNVGTEVALAAVASPDMVYTGIGMLPSPLTVNSGAQYTVVFTATTAMTAGSDTITIIFPSGVVLPATISRTNITVDRDGPGPVGLGCGANDIPGNTVACTGIPLTIDPLVTVSTRTVVLTLPSLTPAGAAAAGVAQNANVTVFFSQLAGITNPITGGAAGSLALNTAGRVSTSQQGVANVGVVVTYTRTLVHSPTNGARGTSVTTTASGLTAGAGASLWVDTDSSDTINGGEVVLASATVSSTDGKATFTWTAFVPPLAAAPNATIKAIDGSGTAGFFTPAATFTINRGITLSVSSGPRGTPITLTGADFTAGENLAGPLANDTDDLTIGGLGCTAANVQATATGTLPTTAICTVPAATPLGAVTVRANVAGVSVATATFTVTSATVTLTPSSAVRGGTVTVSGSGFTPSATVAAVTGVTVNGGHWNSASIAVDANGNLAPTVLTVGTTATNGMIPVPTASGTYTVRVVENTTLREGSATLTVTARPVTLTPSSGPRGTVVTITGSGFNNTSAIGANAITVGGVSGSNLAITTDSAGNLPATSITVGSTTPTGAQTTSVTDSGPLGTVAVPRAPTQTGTATFTVTVPTITASPSTGLTLGSTVTVTGAGWPSTTGTTVTITLTGANATSLPTTLATNTDGSFAAAIVLPTTLGVGAGTITLAAVDTRGNVALSITATQADAAITLSPTSAAVGGTVTVSGTGFLPSTGLTAITIGGATVTPATPIITSSTGSFTAAITVPGLTGVQLVSANVSGTARTVAITVTAAAVTPATQLASLGTNLVVVWGFNAATQTWVLHDPAQPTLSDLTQLVRGQGYYVQVTTAQTLTVGANSYALFPGWNLIGWLG